MSTRRDNFHRWGGVRRILCSVIGHRYEEDVDYMSGDIQDWCSRCETSPVPWLWIDRIRVAGTLIGEIMTTPNDPFVSTITSNVIALLREAGLDGLLLRIEAEPKDGGGFDYSIHHVGSDEDELAITGAFKAVLERHGVSVK